MDFANKLIELRKQKGWSQETLADYLDVSRQAVSKWEAGHAMPDISKLITIADMFNVSLDELVRGMRAPVATEPVAVGPLVSVNSLLRREYKSKAHIFGIPLVHICSRRYGGGPMSVARGIIAIGDVAIGVVAIGGISIGLVALGGISIGLLLALGGFALGGIALGGFALGVFAIGGLSIAAVSALGGAAIAGQAAGGGAAIAPVAVGGGGFADYGFFDNAPIPEWHTFLETAKQYAPNVPKFFLRLIHFIGYANP